jgi:acetyltransferase-like isoleucine patch superfamily enzyme
MSPSATGGIFSFARRPGLSSRLPQALSLLADLPLLRSRIIRWLCRLEGGQIWSPTFRMLMRKHYGVEIGLYSYGVPLWPGGLPEGTRVGNYCSFAHGIQVFRRNHPTDRFSQHPLFYNKHCGLLTKDSIVMVSDRPLEIGHDVWIGANAIITPRCDRIGLGGVVASGAVVTANVPDFTIVAGNPARSIRQRFQPEIAEILIAMRWWEHPVEHLLPLLPVFLKAATLDNAQALAEHLKRYIPLEGDRTARS